MSPRSIALLALLTVCRLAAQEEPARPVAPTPGAEPVVAPAEERSTPPPSDKPKSSPHEPTPAATEPAGAEAHLAPPSHSSGVQAASSDEIASLLHIGQTKLD